MLPTYYFNSEHYFVLRTVQRYNAVKIYVVCHIAIPSGACSLGRLLLPFGRDMFLPIPVFLPYCSLSGTCPHDSNLRSIATGPIESCLLFYLYGCLDHIVNYIQSIYLMTIYLM